MIDCLKIETIEVLQAEGLGLLGSVESFPVIHLPFLAPKKICDCRMVKDESIRLMVIGSVNFHGQQAFGSPLCTLQVTVHKVSVGHWLTEELHCNTDLALCLNHPCPQNRVMLDYVFVSLECLNLIGRVRYHNFP